MDCYCWLFNYWRRITRFSRKRHRKTGSDLQQLASRVHPVFGVIFTTIMYLAIGPFSVFHVQGLSRLKLG